MTDASAITALLGPTNTGKTHRAIERMLEHDSGMIGLPLRLLAREVYDKISARVGEARVALVTGEEQRIPARPSYWVATVEAMPIGREVDFLAVDEIQLAAHDQRGHVFTSRLLSARGRKETWFLGAETMRPVLRELVPTARHVDHPRLSRLSWAGATPLSRLPERSAVVAFSMPHVYEIAEKLRVRRGGAAVVTGALSPRTRNAQVAMFQAGEVDYLVATDAIGMGLNLDVNHVAFSATRKFDGREIREVDESELAQIAGRAGRWIQDGTFGTLSPLDLPMGTVASIETHRFAPLRRVRWRNDDLDFTSLDALRASLSIRPKRAVLLPAFEAEDAAALERLAERDEVRALTSSEAMRRLLWEVCTVPDFRKLLFEVHVDFLGELFVELARAGRLGDDWMASRVHSLGGDGGDVETLVARIAATRTFTYVSNRANWLVSPARWQEETRALEDRLSDALHERLVMRFVDAKKTKPTVRARPRAANVPNAQTFDEPLAVDKSHPFAKLAAFRQVIAPTPPASSPANVPSWIEQVVAAVHADFELEESGEILHRPSGRTLGRLARGSSIFLPDVKLADFAEPGAMLGAGARSRLLRRLMAAARDFAEELLGGVRELAGRNASASMRGLVHRLEQGLGTVLASEMSDVTTNLTAEERNALAHAGVELGTSIVYLPRGLRPSAVKARVALARTFFGAPNLLRAPQGGAVSFVPSKAVPARAWSTIGYPVLGGRAIRADIAERVGAALRPADGRRSHAPSENASPDSLNAAPFDRADELAPTTPSVRDDVELASWVGCTTRELPRIVSALRVRTPRE